MRTLLDLMLDCFGLQRVRFLDLLESYYCPTPKNICLYATTDGKISIEQLRERVLRRLIVKVRKTRQIQTKMLGYYFWKDVGVEKAMDQVKYDPTKFDSEKEFVAHLNCLLAMPFDKDTPLWEIRLFEGFDSNTSLFTIKCSHSFTDGLGVISMTSCIEDDQFTANSPFKSFEPSLLQNLLLPFLALYKIIINMFSKEDIETDANTAKFCERHDYSNTHNDFLISRIYSFKKIKDYAKNVLKISFNELMIGIISKAFHQWLSDYGVKDAKQLQMVCPFSLKQYPTSYDDF